MATAPNVLPIFGPPVQKSYRAAVAHCIRQVKLRHGLNNVSLAETLGCSNQTIANAENEESDLSGVTLMRIAWTYGEEAIAAVRQLYLCNIQEPLTREERFRRIRDDLNALEDER